MVTCGATEGRGTPAVPGKTARAQELADQLLRLAPDLARGVEPVLPVGGAQMDFLCKNKMWFIGAGALLALTAGVLAATAIVAGRNEKRRAIEQEKKEAAAQAEAQERRRQAATEREMPAY